MQGEKSEASVIESLEKIYENEAQFDVVVIIRGGGAQIELDCFNNYDLAFHITQFPLPVLTGIGHERDETVTDLVAHTKLKTPTAVAEFLIDGMAVFLEKIEMMEEHLTSFVTEKISFERETISKLASKLTLATRESLYIAGKNLGNKIFEIGGSVRSSLTRAENLLKEKSIYIRYGLKEQLEGKKQKLDQDRVEVQKIIGIRIKNEAEKLESLMKITDLYDPKNILARGFSITLHNGKALKNAEETSKDDELTTILHKGKITSKVK
jgi:exodeoxyribonuclease VII large subunit